MPDDGMIHILIEVDYLSVVLPKEGYKYVLSRVTFFNFSDISRNFRVIAMKCKNVVVLINNSVFHSNLGKVPGTLIACRNAVNSIF